MIASTEEAIRSGSQVSANGTRRRRQSRRRRQLRLILPLSFLLALAWVIVTAVGSNAHPGGTVSVFPIPGSQVAPPEAQIVFRNVAPGDLTGIVVRGSQSGVHKGKIEADSDQEGGSFIPTRPFIPGERVTVSTPLHILDARHGTFRFTVAQPAGTQPMNGLQIAARAHNDVAHFASRPDLTPPNVEVLKSNPSLHNDIFVAAQQGPLQNGPMILNSRGQLLWFMAMPKTQLATDFRVQRYQNRPVLTFFRGVVRGGVGVGQDVIMNSSYHQIATVNAADGLQADLHTFQLTPHNTALITAYYPVWWNASSVHGASRQIVFDSVVQEIDIKTGLLLYQWDSLDHIPLTDSYTPAPKQAGQSYDYFHLNAVAQTPNHGLLISARDTWAVYKVDSHSGRVVWTLGGKHSSFELGSGVSFAFEHGAVPIPGRPDDIAMFDDGAGPPMIHKQSRGITVHLDQRIRLGHAEMTATLLREDDHSPSLLTTYEGNVQPLADGSQFVGWGGLPYFTEFDRHGNTIFDGRFVDANSSYRAFVLPWHGNPTTRPSVSTSTSGKQTTVSVSWNGATDIASWRILTGTDPSNLNASKTVAWQGFETSVTITTQPYVVVQALDSHGRVLGTSKVVHAT